MIELLERKRIYLLIMKKNANKPYIKRHVISLMQFLTRKIQF